MSRFSATLGEWMAPLFLVAVLISVYEVVLRYAFNAPTVWVHLEREEHIRVTVISDRLPRPARRAVALLNIGLAMVFLLAIVWGGWSHAWEALSNWHRTRTAFNSPTPAILKPLIVLTAAAMVLQILVNWRRNGPNR